MCDLSDLLEQIREAFADTVYPGDDDLCGSAATDWESAQVAQRLRGKDWRQVDGQTIRPYSDGLPLITAAAFCYYLPAFLLNILKGQEDEDHNDILAQGTLGELAYIMDAAQRAAQGKKPSRYRSDYSGYLPLLTRPQRQAVHDFFGYYFATFPDEIYFPVMFMGLADEDQEAFTQRILGLWKQAIEDTPPIHNAIDRSGTH